MNIRENIVRIPFLQVNSKIFDFPCFYFLLPLHLSSSFRNTSDCISVFFRLLHDVTVQFDFCGRSRPIDPRIHAMCNSSSVLSLLKFKLFRQFLHIYISRLHNFIISTCIVTKVKSEFSAVRNDD